MRARWLVVPILVAVAALAGGAWLLFSSASRPVAVTPVAAEEGEDQSAPGAARSLRDPSVDRAADAALPDEQPEIGAAFLEGRVIDDAGQPLPAEVLVAWSDPEEPRQLFPDFETEQGRCEVDVDGRFRSPGLPPASGARLRVSAAGFGGLARKVVLTAGTTLDLGDMVLRPQALVRGSVRTLEGDGVAGAVIRDRDQEYGRANELGEFVLEDLAAGELWLYAEAEGFAALTVPPLRLRPGQVVEGLELLVDPACVLRGTVTSLDGRPISAAEVEASLIRHAVVPDRGQNRRRDGVRSPSARTDAEGRFALGPLPRGEVRVRATALGYDGETEVCESDHQDLVLRLEPDAMVFGTVLDAQSGAPVEFGRVHLQQKRGANWHAVDRGRAPQADWETGEFRLEVRRGRELRVLVEGLTFVRMVSRSFELEDDAPYGPIQLEVQSGVSLRGSVRDDLGEAVAGARVSLIELSVASNLQLGRDLGLDSVRTGVDGTFRSAPLAQGRYRVDVRHEGMFRRSSPEVWVEGDREPEPLSMVMDRGGFIVGELRPLLLGTEGSVSVVATAQVEEGEQAPDPPQRRADVERGAFRVGPLQPGTWSVSLVEAIQWRWSGTFRRRGGEGASMSSSPGPVGPSRGRGGGPGSSDGLFSRRGAQRDGTREGTSWITHPSVSVRAGEETWLNLEVAEDECRRVVGKLIVNGLPQAFGRVELRTGSIEMTCTTDRLGSYEFEGVFGDSVMLSASHRSDRPLFGHQLHQLQSGVEHVIDLHIDTGAIAGRAVMVDGEALSGASVEVEVLNAPMSSDWLTWFEQRVEADGRFEIGEIPTGAIRVTVSKRDHFGPPPSDHSLVAGARLAVGDYVLGPSGNVWVTLETAAGERSSQSFRMIARGADGSEREGRGRNGRCYIRALAPGAYELELNFEDGRALRKAVTVVPGNTERVSLREG